ncbi:methylated-DNA--[protein]-cysteine S-methyltransferase [Pontibacter silvestris]|uniref:Methylated-DNA--protein-cysteine methyltransferase n=1 Tax=Pontibacter silvestris TaxID=2305183 RepID=A0ABW4WTM3_9BACT|nr:methylated-DNA--[protein]-cysteine S-methyltransferase [Pontibacter silvestris]MCC9138585.1 methylated-DNA--[protein]-cysteine S-methyltransferase [Pontibacter silvestris]
MIDLNSHTTYYNSPIGTLRITGTSESITAVLFSEEPTVAASLTPPTCLTTCVQQLEEYFHKERQTFDLPLQATGTVFQQQVWKQLQSIAFGKVASYMDVARATSGEKAIRAIGAANAKNPISIVVPCHRVIGSDNSLTGYAWGLWRKEWLLRHEGYLPANKQLVLF